jgi:hypothetical protein
MTIPISNEFSRYGADCTLRDVMEENQRIPEPMEEFVVVKHITGPKIVVFTNDALCPPATVLPIVVGLSSRPLLQL